jgi:hypothetical protein
LLWFMILNTILLKECNVNKTFKFRRWVFSW